MPNCLVAPFDSTGQIDRVPQRSIFELMSAADIADHSRAGIDAHPDCKRTAQRSGPGFGHARQRLGDGQRRLARPSRVIGLFGRRIPHGHQAIARVIDDHAFAFCEFARLFLPGRRGSVGRCRAAQPLRQIARNLEYRKRAR